MVRLLSAALVTASLWVGPLAGEPFAADEPTWLRPYPGQLPSFWVHLHTWTGSPQQPLFLGPYIRAFATVRDATESGDRIALLANVASIYDSDIQGNLTPQRRMVQELAELRFVGSDSAGVSLELREAAKAPDSCIVDVMNRLAYRLDIHIQSIASCEQLVAWGPPRALRFRLQGAYTLAHSADRQFALPLTFAAVGNGLSVRVNTP